MSNSIRSIITRSNRFVYSIKLIKGNHFVSEGYLFTTSVFDVRLYLEYQKVYEHSNHLASMCFDEYKNAVLKIQLQEKQ